MRDTVIPVMVNHAVHYATGLACDAALLGGVDPAVKLYNALLYQTWWELLQHEIEKNPNMEDFSYRKALDKCVLFITHRLPDLNGQATAFTNGRQLLKELAGLEANNG